MDPLAELAARWRERADEREREGALVPAARLYRRIAEELEAAMASQRLQAVSLEEAANMGGYSYSHLQHLVADGEIPNVGEEGAPRIRRCDVPRKPGHGANRPGKTKGELLDEDVRQLREAQTA